jgi:glycosyltransferase involved in cell wall biosynthesis
VAEQKITVVHAVVGLHVGGVNRSLLTALRALQGGEQRHVLCVLGTNLSMAPAFEAEGIPVVSLGHRGGRDTLRTTWRMRALLRSERAAVLHTHLELASTLGAVAALAARTPQVVSVHVIPGSSHPEGAAHYGLGRRWYSPSLLAERHLCTVLLAVSQAVADAQAAGEPGTAGRILVVHNGIDLTTFDPPPAEVLDRLRGELGLVPGEPVLINVGRMVPIKRQRALVPIVAELVRIRPDVRLLIVGRGEEEEPVRRAVADAGLAERISVLGLRDDVAALLRLADALLIASGSEGFGMIAAEAMACELPVVSTPLAAVREVLGDLGTYAEVDDPAAYAAAVAALLDDPARRAELGRAGRARVVERFSSEATARRLEALYAELAAAGRGWVKGR